MALDRHDIAGPNVPQLELRDDDRFTGYEAEGERSNFAAFLMGGVVVAGGLLAFLYYDTDNLSAQNNRDLLTTGSIGRIESPVSATVPSVRVLPPATERPAAP